MKVIREGFSENGTLELRLSMRKDPVTRQQTEIRGMTSTKVLEWENFSFQGQKEDQTRVIRANDALGERSERLAQPLRLMCCRSRKQCHYAECFTGTVLLSKTRTLIYLPTLSFPLRCEKKAVSPLAFLVVLEVLDRAIRQEKKNTKDILIRKEEVK